jgi:5-methylcytosine-specific restriction endonuclease McrA
MTVPIQRFPASMTGRKLRKELGLPEYPKAEADRDFKLSAKFQNIPQQKRLAYLLGEVDKIIAPRNVRELKSARGNFNRIKNDHLPMSENCPCYVCATPATVRHHVLPLMNGGRNKRNNIVPLCAACHAKIHPHLR